MMPAFPSLEWFEAVKDLVNQDEAFRRLGTVDARVGVKVGDKTYELTFEAFECAGVREIGPEGLRDCDFWLEQEPEAWEDMISNIQQNGKADLSHTLNTIDLTLPDGFARSHDGYRRDAFYRFIQSLQNFFDSSARLETAFAI
jgi:hypothetical protein